MKRDRQLYPFEDFIYVISILLVKPVFMQIAFNVVIARIFEIDGISYFEAFGIMATFAVFRMAYVPKKLPDIATIEQVKRTAVLYTFVLILLTILNFII